MKQAKYVFAALLIMVLAPCTGARAQAVSSRQVIHSLGSTTVQDGSDDVFIPVSKYMAAGNVEALSAWFAENLEIAVLSRESAASKAQACRILKTFFDNYTPRSFDVTHTAGRAGMKYALGTLKAGGETFHVTIFMSCKDGTYRIQQLKIERI